MTGWADGDADALAGAGPCGRRDAGAWVAEALRRPTWPAPGRPDRSSRTRRCAGPGRRSRGRSPDRFYVRVEQDGAAPATVHGRPIPDELPIGLADPTLDASSRSTARTCRRSTIPALAGRVLRAEEVGMAVTVTLSVPRRTVHPPPRRLRCTGRAGPGPRRAAAGLACSARTASPTAPSSWRKARRRTTPSPPGRRGADAPRRTTGPRRSDVLDSGQRCGGSAALGLDPSCCTLLAGARPRADPSRGVQPALWTTTWGDAIEHLTPAGRANGDKRLDSVSWTPYATTGSTTSVVAVHCPCCGSAVSRTGPALVVTDPTRRGGRRTAGSSRPAWSRLSINRSAWMWEDAAADVPTLVSGPLDTTLPEILGTDAVLRALRVRTALSPDPRARGRDGADGARPRRASRRSSKSRTHCYCSRASIRAP